MVDGIVHNAAVSMQVRGLVFEPEPVPRHALARWLGRGSAALGAAASLVAGTVLGGAFQGIPIVLAPPVSAASAAQAPARPVAAGAAQDDVIDPGPGRALRPPAPIPDAPGAMGTSPRSSTTSRSAPGASGCPSATAACPGSRSSEGGGVAPGANGLEQAAALVRSVMAGLPADIAAKLAATVVDLTAATSSLSALTGALTPPGA
jgi:hypothetical protein